MVEVSLILTKPHVALEIQGEVKKVLLQRIPNTVILKEKLILGERSVIEKHYEEHKKKSFFPELVQMFEGKKFYALAVLGGEGMVKEIRKIVGATNPKKAEPGTIRREFYEKYGGSIGENFIHASATPEDGIREVLNFFPEERERLEALGLRIEANKEIAKKLI
jgi:nucleoside-diphosphate kinase